MVVLSLFDGMSCGRIALDRAGIKVDKYYASEIDKYAQIVSTKNYPDIIRLGDVTKWREWSIEKPDIIIAGSPCQGFSFAGKQLNFNDPRSALFFTFVDILEFYKPKYFLLENVKMKKEYKDVISKRLGVEPIEINSALVSAQNRKRLYWTNIPGITQPEDKGILLKDIIESGRKCDLRNKGGKNLLASNIDKSHTILSRDYKGIGNFQGSAVSVDSDGAYRRLSPIEYERLQTVPDNYTAHVSNSQRYKMLGNGWTVDVIAHIFSFIK